MSPAGAAPYENLGYLTSLHHVPANTYFDQAAQNLPEVWGQSMEPINLQSGLG